MKKQDKTLLERNTWCHMNTNSVSWGYKIHQLSLKRNKTPSLNKCTGYDIKQSNVETPLMLEL